MSSRVEPILTVADLDAMPDDENRYEIIEGELFVSRSPGFRHQFISDNLIELFRTYLKRHPIGTVVSAMGVVLSDVSAVIPDIVFMSHERRKSILEGDRIIAAPDLAIEILSPGSDNERRDRTAKRQLYGKHGVGEYWLVDPETRTIEVFSLESNRMRLAGTYSESDEISSDLLPGFSCPVQLVFSV